MPVSIQNSIITVILAIENVLESGSPLWSRIIFNPVLTGHTGL